MNNKLKKLEQMRHSCAHLLAAAVLELWPGTQNAIGPSIENGFYQDFDFADVKISEEDFSKIEHKMHQIESSWKEFEVKEVSVEQARKDFSHNKYKLELIEELAQGGKKITENNPGNFLDLCKGGHVSDPKNELKHFKLLSIAGAYWRGSEKNKMLTRIYGTCFPTQKELDHYLWQQEEAKKRDHRKLGKELQLFMLNPMVGSGLPLWLPNGTIIKEEIEKFAKETEEKNGYKRVSTPHVAKKELFQASGHLPYYKDSMYPPMKLDDGDYYLKAMNCPMTHLIFKNIAKSYRDLPIRLAEYGTVYRYELSGTLSGLLRVRGMTQNDAHIYCTKEQIKEEFKKVMELHKHYYKIFGIKDYYMRLSLHDPTKKEKYIDEPALWEFSEKMIKEAMRESGLPFVETVGEAAFYGPKIDFQIKSVIGREESASTNQLDFTASKRFNLHYIGSDGKEKPVFVIHRAPLGSHERFIAFLMEHYAGAFPLWLAPVQVMIMPIADRHEKTARKITQELKDNGIRAEIDNRPERLQAKIRDSSLQKVPYLGIIGDKEIQNSEFRIQNYDKILLSIRTREGKDLGQIKLSKFITRLKEEIDKKI